MHKNSKLYQTKVKALRKARAALKRKRLAMAMGAGQPKLFGVKKRTETVTAQTFSNGQLTAEIATTANRLRELLRQQANEAQEMVTTLDGILPPSLGQ